MTLDQEFATYKGQSLLVPSDTEADRGQCVQWVDYVLHDVYGLPYHFGNAIDWWYSPGELLNHFDKITDGSVKKGDLVVFNSQVGSIYGHIDVAMSDGSTANFQGADSNWGGNKTVHLVQHAAPGFVLGSLRFKGGNMLDQGGIVELYQAALFRSPNQGEIDSWIGKDYHELVHSLNVNNADLKNKAANFDQIYAQLQALQNQPAAQQLAAIKKIIDG